MSEGVHRDSVDSEASDGPAFGVLPRVITGLTLIVCLLVPFNGLPRSPLLVVQLVRIYHGISGPSIRCVLYDLSIEAVTASFADLPDLVVNVDLGTINELVLLTGDQEALLYHLVHMIPKFLIHG